MIEFGITVVLVALLAAVVIFLKKRKKCSSCCSSKETPKSEPKDPEQVKQQPETKSVDEPVVNAESTSVNPQITDATVVAPIELEPANIEPPAKPQVSAKQQTKEAAVSPAENITSSLLPEDSVLKRHYLTNVCTMIESLVPSRPTDSVLCRHYDAMIAAEIDQCLNDKTAMEKLIHDYENRK
jgi:hypothetical protein